jgi:hypothetical protein
MAACRAFERAKIVIGLRRQLDAGERSPFAARRAGRPIQLVHIDLAGLSEAHVALLCCHARREHDLSP